MSKTIVTHISVDLDAIASSWLIKRFMPSWKDANMAFVPAGNTLNNIEPDSNPDIVHTDTGLGMFDHHQLDDPDKLFSATERVYDYLNRKKFIKKTHAPALEKIVNFATSIDHFGELYFHDPTSDVYDFLLSQILEGFKAISPSDLHSVETGHLCLDSVFYIFIQKISAEKDVRNGYIFKTKWGKAIAIETNNEESLKIALKSGFMIVVKKSAETGYARIKSQPVKEIDLTPVYEKIIKIDPKATWYLHMSKHMLLNGSMKRPDSIPSSLSIKKIIEIIRSIA